MKFLAWLAGDWNSEPPVVVIPPGTEFPVDISAVSKRRVLLERAIRYLGPKYCLHRPYRKPQ